MEFNEIFGYILSAIGGGGLMKIINIRSEKKKAAVEVKLDEIQAIHNTIEMVYQPIIDQQNKRIQELEGEVRELRTQLTSERKEHQKDIDLMNKRILAITNALGLKADTRLRDDNVRYKKNEQ
jgi:hypothetical protein